MIVSTNPNFHPELPSIPIPIIGDITSDRDGNVLIMTAPWEIKKLDVPANSLQVSILKMSFSITTQAYFGIQKLLFTRKAKSMC